MKECRLNHSPIVYYVSAEAHKEWILFLHAAFVNHNMFQTQTAYFKDRYNVLTLDIIGHGKSTETKRKDAIDGMSVWINEILEKENIRKLHIVGVSLGAVLAQDFANRYPQKVQSLACFGGYDINNFDMKMQKDNGAAQMRMMLKAIFSVRWFASSNKKISAFTPQAQNRFYEMNLQFPKKSFQYLASLNKMINVRQTVPREYPLLIGCGEHDIPMELSAIEHWKNREPSCSVIIFEGAGHCVNMDVPEQFHKALENFWSAGHEKLCHIPAENIQNA